MEKWLYRFLTFISHFSLLRKLKTEEAVDQHKTVCGSHVNDSLVTHIAHHLYLQASTMKFESILSEINGFGKFQIMIVLIQSVSRITLPAHFLLNIFIAAVPPHHCATGDWLPEDALFKSLTLDQRLNVSIPLEADGEKSSCFMFSNPQYHLLFNTSNITSATKVPCQKGWVYDNSTFKSTLASEVQ